MTKLKTEGKRKNIMNGDTKKKKKMKEGRNGKRKEGANEEIELEEIIKTVKERMM